MSLSYNFSGRKGSYWYACRKTVSYCVFAVLLLRVGAAGAVSAGAAVVCVLPACELLVEWSPVPSELERLVLLELELLLLELLLLELELLALLVLELLFAFVVDGAEVAPAGMELSYSCCVRSSWAFSLAFSVMPSVSASVVRSFWRSGIQ